MAVGMGFYVEINLRFLMDPLNQPENIPTTSSDDEMSVVVPPPAPIESTVVEHRKSPMNLIVMLIVLAATIYDIVLKFQKGC